MPLDQNQPDEFELARRRAAQRSSADVQKAQDAMKRRFAALGGGARGASIKADQQIQQQASEQLANVNEGIDTAQRQENRRVSEIKEARDFAKSEREAQQAFASSERAAGQQFQSSMLGKQQDFAKQERIASERFQGAQSAEQRSQAERFFKSEMKFKEMAERTRHSEFGKQYELAMKQYNLDEKVTNANLEMQKWSQEGQMSRLRKAGSAEGNWWGYFKGENTASPDAAGTGGIGMGGWF